VIEQQEERGEVEQEEVCEDESVGDDDIVVEGEEGVQAAERLGANIAEEAMRL